jgi:hypothetical protein
MKQHQNFRLWYLASALALLFLMSCDSYDYSDTNDYKYTTPETVTQLQFVTVTFDGPISISKPVAKIDTFNIDLIVSDSAFSFVVPSTLPPGNKKLRVNSLNYLSIDYNVKELVLPKPAVEIMTDFSADLDNIDKHFGKGSERDIENISSTINQFKNYYNSLSSSDKNEIAKVYWANKELYDALLNINTDEQSKAQKISRKMRLNLVGFLASVAGIDAGAVLIRTKTPWAAALGVATAGVATAVALTTLENMYKEVYIEQNGLFKNITEELYKIKAVQFENNAQKNNRIDFVSGRQKTLSVENDATNLHNGSNNASNLQMKSFFWGYNTINDFVTKLNEAIKWGNDNIPLFNFSLINFTKLPTTIQKKSYLIEQDDFDNYSFTVSDNRISLQKVAFASNGKINFQLKIADDVKVDTIVTKLNYNFEGVFNSFNGSVDIRVIREAAGFSLIGTWEAVNYFGDVIGKWETYNSNPECPNLISGEYVSPSLRWIFEEEKFTQVSQQTWKEHQYSNLDPTNCSYTSVKIETTNSSDTATGTYLFDGKKIDIILVEDDDDDSFSISLTFIDANTFILGSGTGDGGALFKRK